MTLAHILHCAMHYGFYNPNSKVVNALLMHWTRDTFTYQSYIKSFIIIQLLTR